jgi:hypothetical protein
MHGDVLNFFSALTEGIALARKDAVIAESRPTYENVRTLVARLSRDRVKLVLLLDEFEAITLNRNFTIEFFSFLRSLPNNYSVSFIVSSAHELQEFCHSREIAGSPFFNIFHKLNLGCLAPEEAHELIVRPSRGASNSTMNIPKRITWTRPTSGRDSMKKHKTILNTSGITSASGSGPCVSR